jgi:hypothetical protein
MRTGIASCSTSLTFFIASARWASLGLGLSLVVAWGAVWYGLLTVLWCKCRDTFARPHTPSSLQPASPIYAKKWLRRTLQIAALPRCNLCLRGKQYYFNLRRPVGRHPVPRHPAAQPEA